MAIVILLLRPHTAAALWRHGPVALDGSFRTVGVAIRNDVFGDERTEVLSQTLLRLTLTGPVRDRAEFEFHAVQSLDATTGGAATLAGNEAFSLVRGETRYRALDATADWHGDPRRRATLFVDQANVSVRLGRLDLTAGRQAVTFGKTFFWNPLDVFLPFDPRQFDQEYKPGVDAVRLDVALGPFTGLTFIGAPGRTLDALGRARSDDHADATWFGSALLARAFTTWRGFDLALQGGKVYGGAHLGGGATGELGPVEVRTEIAQLLAAGSPPLLPGTFPNDERLVEDAFTVVVGLGHRFESSLTIETEYFRNGAGDSGALDASLLRFLSGGTLDLGENLVATLVSYELLPIVTGSIAGIVNVDDPSGQIQPGLVWSAADEVEVLAGGILNFGERPGTTAGANPLRPDLASEFGSFPDVGYAEVKVYF